jgi:DNA-directed RNA polymerase specialized sigma24 family protein
LAAGERAEKTSRTSWLISKEESLSGSARASHLNWELTEEAFAKFLACLDPEPARAGEKYEALRQALVKFLDWRGAPFPDELVDETFNRVTRKLEEGETIRDMPAYCHGVARMVLLQSLERPGNKRVGLEELSMSAIPEQDVTDVRREYLNQCLRQLTAENRELIMEYYRKDGRQKNDHRVAMAERLGIPLNALWSRAQRIRDKLERCIMRRLKDHNLRPTGKRL